MATWAELEAAAPELAGHGRRLLQHGETLAGFLATVRGDGGPRVHPVFPVLAGGRLYAFIVDLSYKYRDLRRDGRYALHTFPAQGGGEEFYLDGLAREITEVETRAAVSAATGGRQGTQPFECLFELELQRVLYTRWDRWSTEHPWPNYQKWSAPRARD